MSDQNVDVISSQVPKFGPGPYLAKVVSNIEPSYMGSLDVKLLRPVGNTDSAGQLFTVKYMSPFYGSTSNDYTTTTDDYNNTQKSYGMWMVPPDVGATVVVIFIEGNPKRGYWIGCVPDESMNFSVPGLAATKYAVGGGGRVPVTEYNKKAHSQVTSVTKTPKPKHPLADVLTAQGLIMDDIRGITSSSARREAPSQVYGISTPGPVDKRGGAKKGPVGKHNAKVNAFVSRLGGTTFVMDDGDAAFLRKKPASEGPPEYVHAEGEETGGNVEIPHNELVRIRTRTGHQILLHNSEDLIYIGNAKGTTWIELTSNGKIDIYAADSISIHTENDLNVTADRDINLNAGGNINMKSGGYNKIKAGGNHEVKAANTYIDGGDIHLNSGLATNALQPGRVPQAEPWNGHENLDPVSVKPDKTKATESPTSAAPAFYKKYTTATDTFEQIKPAKK